MVIITGGAGFIGSNLVKTLTERGREDILIVDNMTNGVKFLNLVDCTIADYQDKEEFIATVESGREFREPVEAVFHLGACSSTTEWDGKYIMKNNYQYSMLLLDYCMSRKIPFLYASSAAVYGAGQVFREEPELEAPLNVYGYSKLLFDQQIRRRLGRAQSQIVGFRYFNVYGPRERHKGTMASVASHLHRQMKESDRVRLFAGCDGYADGEQRRDFIYVDDAVDTKLWFLDHPERSGIFNVGTGRSQTFNDVANAVLAYHNQGSIEYIDFPDHLRGRYQSFTDADISALRAVGYERPFRPVEEGVPAYLAWLEQQPDALPATG